MDFILRINMNNRAFKHAFQKAELKRILSKVTYQIGIGKVSSNIIDVNGNTVGSWKITTDININKELEEFIEHDKEE